MADTRGLIINYGPNILYFLFKIINPATRIGIFNLNNEVDKENISKFIINLNTLLITCPQITLSLLIRRTPVVLC